MKYISGIHHVSIRCLCDEDFAKEKEFYGKVLELEVAREWPTGIMFASGEGYIEVTRSDDASSGRGVINHFAFRTSDVDACVKRVKEYGYEVFAEPKDIVIKADPEYPARIAFCKGPLGEDIEFFCEK